MKIFHFIIICFFLSSPAFAYTKAQDECLSHITNGDDIRELNSKSDELGKLIVRVTDFNNFAKGTYKEIHQFILNTVRPMQLSMQYASFNNAMFMLLVQDGINASNSKIIPNAFEITSIVNQLLAVEFFGVKQALSNLDLKSLSNEERLVVNNIDNLNSYFYGKYKDCELGLK